MKAPKLPPDLPSIGREVSPEELDAAMEHSLNNAVVKCPDCGRPWEDHELCVPSPCCPIGFSK